MELDKIIEGLNTKNNVLSIDSSLLDNLGLTETEKAFIEKYKPQKSFIIYGTLAPGRPNHSVIQHIKGEWREGIVKGKLINKGWGADMGYNGFVPANEEQQEIKVFVLTSDELQENWERLDEFEGSGYKRILAKYKLDNGKIGVGYIYAINELK